jgi:regulator of protease activity HflC (stomatin/prohibitin superfamily)
MTDLTLPPDPSKWQQLYSASESRWKDVERMRAFLLPMIALVFIMVMYVAVGYEFVHMEDWVPEEINQLSYILYLLRIVLLILVPVAAVVFGLWFIFKQAATFVHAFYQPAEDEKLGRLIGRKLLGVVPVPPPLHNVFKYPFVVLREPKLAENHWARWFGGPATLVIYDGIAVYLERGNKFSRVVGPGLPMSFLEQNERIKEVVDLRPQTRTGEVKPWTKDGIRIRFAIRVECQIDASAEAVIQSSQKFRFSYDPLAVKMAVERMTVRADPKGELYEGSWLDGAWGTITGVINAYIAGHTLDELFLASETDKILSLAPAESGTYVKIEQVLSYKIKEQLEKAKRNLAQNGVKVLSVQIVNVEVPPRVQELRGKYWESAKERIAALRNSRAEADRIRIREQAHAEAQRTMLNTITQRLEKVDPNNLTEPLILSLSGILDQGLDDPIVRPLIAKESFAVLERVRRMLNEGF